MLAPLVIRVVTTSRSCALDHSPRQFSRRWVTSSISTPWRPRASRKTPKSSTTVRRDAKRQASLHSIAGSICCASPCVFKPSRQLHAISIFFSFLGFPQTVNPPGELIALQNNSILRVLDIQSKSPGVGSAKHESSFQCITPLAGSKEVSIILFFFC